MPFSGHGKLLKVPLCFSKIVRVLGWGACGHLWWNISDSALLFLDDDDFAWKRVHWKDLSSRLAFPQASGISSVPRSLPNLSELCLYPIQSLVGLRVGYKITSQSPSVSELQLLPLREYSPRSLTKLHLLVCGKILLSQHAFSPQIYPQDSLLLSLQRLNLL